MPLPDPLPPPGLAAAGGAGVYAFQSLQLEVVSFRSFTFCHCSRASNASSQALWRYLGQPLCSAMTSSASLHLSLKMCARTLHASMRCFRRVHVEEFDEGLAGSVITLQTLLDHLAPVVKVLVALQGLAPQAHPLRNLSAHRVSIPNVPAIAEELSVDVLDGMLPQGLQELIRCAKLQVHIGRSIPWGGSCHGRQVGSEIERLPDRIFTPRSSSR